MYNPFKRSPIWYNYRRLSKLGLHNDVINSKGSGNRNREWANGFGTWSLLYWVYAFQTTPLHLAARNGHVDVVAKLLEKAADVSTKDEDG